MNNGPLLKIHQTIPSACIACIKIGIDFSTSHPAHLTSKLWYSNANYMVLEFLTVELAGMQNRKRTTKIWLMDISFMHVL